MAFLPYPSPSPSPAVRRYAGLEAPSAPSTQQPGPAFLMTLSPQTGPFTRPSAFLKGICCSVAQSCPTLCDPMGCSNPGFPVLMVSWSLLKLMSIETWCCPNLSVPHFSSCLQFSPGSGYLTPVFLPGGFHEQRSLAGYSPWGRRESDTTATTNTLTSLLLVLLLFPWTSVRPTPSKPRPESMFPEQIPEAICWEPSYSASHSLGSPPSLPCESWLYLQRTSSDFPSCLEMRMFLSSPELLWCSGQCLAYGSSSIHICWNERKCFLIQREDETHSTELLTVAKGKALLTVQYWRWRAGRGRHGSQEGVCTSTRFPFSWWIRNRQHFTWAFKPCISILFISVWTK